MIWHEIVQFINEDINTRNLDVSVDGDVIKKFKDEFGNDFIEISLYISTSTSLLNAVCYWIEYDRDWWAKQDMETKDKFKNLTFEVNNIDLSVCSFISIESPITGRSLIKYYNCVFDKSTNFLVGTHHKIETESCIMI